MSINSVENLGLCGYLLKQSPKGLKCWQKRFFCVYETFITYGRNNNEQRVLGMIIILYSLLSNFGSNDSPLWIIGTIALLAIKSVIVCSTEIKIVTKKRTFRLLVDGYIFILIIYSIFTAWVVYSQASSDREASRWAEVLSKRLRKLESSIEQLLGITPGRMQF